MLYSSFVAIFGSGTAASTAGEYRVLYANGDIAKAKRLLRDSLIEAFTLMGTLAILMCTFDESLISVFLNNADLIESRSVAV